MAFLFLIGDAQALLGLVKTPRHAKTIELSKKSGDCSKHPSSNMSNVDRFKPGFFRGLFGWSRPLATGILVVRDPRGYNIKKYNEIYRLNDT